MNELEKVLLDATDEALDFYLEITKTEDIRQHILEIKEKAEVATDGGRIKKMIQQVLDKV